MLSQEIGEVAALVNFIASEAADNKKQLKIVDETVSKHTSEIGELFQLVSVMRVELDVMKKQINELIVLKQQVAVSIVFYSKLQINLNFANIFMFLSATKR